MAGVIALLALASLAMVVGVPQVQNDIQSKTGMMETPEHYSTTPPPKPEPTPEPMPER